MVERVCPQCGEDGHDRKGSLNKRTVCPSCGYVFRYEQEVDVPDQNAVFRRHFSCETCGNEWSHDFETEYQVFDNAEHPETRKSRGVEISEPGAGGRKWDVICPNCETKNQVYSEEKTPL